MAAFPLPNGNVLLVRNHEDNEIRTLQIPVGPERFERAATLAIWGPWRSGPL